MSLALAENPVDPIIGQQVLPGFEEWAPPVPERLLGLLDDLQAPNSVQPARAVERAESKPVPTSVRVAALALDAALGRQPGGASLAALPVRELVQHSKTHMTEADRDLLVGPAAPNGSLYLSDTADGHKGADAYPRDWIKKMDEAGKLDARWERFAGMDDDEIDDQLFFEIQKAHYQKFIDRDAAKADLRAKNARMDARREELIDSLTQRKQFEYLENLEAKKAERTEQRAATRATRAETRNEKIRQKFTSAIGAVASLAKTGGDWRNRASAATLGPRLLGY